MMPAVWRLPIAAGIRLLDAAVKWPDCSKDFQHMNCFDRYGNTTGLSMTKDNSLQGCLVGSYAFDKDH